MNEPRPIENRADVQLLVESFYGRVRKDELIGPIFNGVIGDETSWAHHIQKLTDFWETNLFVRAAYKGNPMRAHMEVDRQVNSTIGQQHFDRWLQIWEATIQELFIGERAEKARRNANNMAALIFAKIQFFRKVQ